MDGWVGVMPVLRFVVDGWVDVMPVLRIVVDGWMGRLFCLEAFARIL